MRLAQLLAECAGVEDFAALPDDHLRGLRDDIVQAARAARSAEDFTSEVATLIAGGVDHAQKIDAELASRDAEAAQALALADGALAKLGDDGSGPEAIAASGRPAVRVPARHRPRVARTGITTLVASDSVEGLIASGGEYDGLDAATAGLYEKAERVRMSAEADGTQHHVVTMGWADSYPPERRITGRESSDDIGAKFAQVAREHREQIEALTASGGIPGPPEPRYDQLVYGIATRPVRDALPRILAQRGEIIFNPAPLLDEILVDQSGAAIGTVTAAQDLSGATKSVQEVSAPTSSTAVVRALPMRFQTGNFSDKFYPERTRAFQSLGQTGWARHADQLLLEDLKAGSVKYTNPDAHYGAYRDFRRQLLALSEEIEDHVRDANVPLRCIVPEFLPSMLVSDLLAQQPGDDTLGLTEEAMRQRMNSWDPNVSFTFAFDSIRGRTSTTPTGQSPRTPAFDADLEWCMFPEGSWMFLDSGSLDLGIVRDSTLNATNKFQTFYEAFEGVAHVVPGLSYWITSSLCAGGHSQIATDVAECSPSGS